MKKLAALLLVFVSITAQAQKQDSSRLQLRPESNGGYLLTSSHWSLNFYSGDTYSTIRIPNNQINKVARLLDSLFKANGILTIYEEKKRGR